VRCLLEKTRIKPIVNNQKGGRAVHLPDPVSDNSHFTTTMKYHLTLESIPGFRMEPDG
jgi:hypothetical protein